VNSSIATGLLAALGAAVVYGTGPVLQAVAAARTPVSGGFGVLLLVRLVRRPLWLAGFGCEVGGFVLEAYAFSTAPTTLVAPVLAVDMVVFVLISRLAFAARLAVRGWTGVLAIAVAIALLAGSFGNGGELGRPASTVALISFAVGSVVAGGIGVLVAASIGDTRPLLAAGALSAAAGVAYGLATATTRQVGRTFAPDSPWHLLTTPTPYVLAVTSIVGILLMQRALQVRPVLTFPVVSAGSALVPVLLGVSLFDDEVPSGAGLAGFVAALVLVAVGVALLGADRAAAERAREDAPSVEPRRDGDSAT
jgi:drug/metabolite transporter (DMT)-like permease